MFKLMAASWLCVVGLAAQASGYVFQCRWVERIGTTDIVLGGDGATLPSDGLPHRIRLQMGVFDETGSPAPAGGFVGWRQGVLTATGGINTRTPGRIAPFNFATAPTADGDPPRPDGDPFMSLVSIDATLGTQTLTWGCENGQPLPQPPATVRGRNSFVSVFEFTTAGTIDQPVYTITASGNLVGASEWRMVGSHGHPDCENGIPGSVTYAPFPTPDRAFTCTLNFIIPGPTSVVGVACFCVWGWRRRRGAARS